MTKVTNQEKLVVSESFGIENAGTGRPTARGVKKILLLTVSGFFFVLGVLGAILPGLPATPFLLLTSYFLVRSSPALNERLRRSRFLGPILTDWQVHGGVRTHVKIKAVGVVLVTVAATVYFSGYSPTLSLLVLGLAAIGIVVIYRLPQTRSPSSK